MNVAQYTFQSPYSSPLQVGRLDPSSVKEEAKAETEESTSANSSQSAPVVNETLSSAQKFEATQTGEVTSTVESNQLLDVYA